MNKKETEEYFTAISSKFTTDLQKINKKKKDINADNDINTNLVKLHEYNKLIENNYSLPQIKNICKQFGLKVGGTKQELLLRAYSHMRLNVYAIKLQKHIRRNFVKRFLKLHGPIFNHKYNNNNKSTIQCTNNSDFYTMEPLEDIHPLQLFSYKDDDGFIYGFDIVSIHNLICKSDGNPTNPYNRNELSYGVRSDLLALIFLSFIINFDLQLELDEDTDEIDENKAVELEALRLFQMINALGNYSDIKWFMDLNQAQLVKFYRELVDIWNYRAQISENVKADICPPFGYPFAHLSRMPMNHLAALEINMLRNHMLIIIDKFVTSGINNESKSLGAIYVLGALTLVSSDAAATMPWLFQSFI